MRQHPVIFMFSGQGSHYFQMGEELYRQHPVFRQTLLELNEIARALLNESIVDILYNPNCKKMDVFEKTRETHPAIFMVEIALAQTLIKEGVRPDYVLGASMGSFAAAVVAGCLDAEQALTAVIKQAEMLEARCDAGGMLAILSDPLQFHREANLYQYSELAAVNFDQHFVVSADAGKLEHIEKFLGEDLSWQRLAVSQAFHSEQIDTAKERYLDFLKDQSLAPPSIPIICCADSGVLTELPDSYFWQIVREPIYFQKTIQSLEDKNTFHYIDLGPAGTLATFLKYNLKPESSSRVNAIMTPYGNELSRLKSLFKDRDIYQ